MIKNGTGTEQAWAVFNKGGYIFLDTVRTQRNASIEAWHKASSFTFAQDWRWAKKIYGVYVAKVEVTAKAEVKG